MVGRFHGVLLLSAKYSGFTLMGKHLTKGDPECPSTDQQYCLEQWSIITLFLRKTNLDCISSAQKSCQVYSSVMHCMRVSIWKGDIMVADIEELEEMDALEIHARRLNAKEVLTPMKGDRVMFPVADGTVKIFGGDRRLRPAPLIRDCPASETIIILNEERNKKFFEENQTDSLLQLLFKMTQHGTMRKPKNHFWSISGDSIYRHHVEPKSNCTCRKKNHFYSNEVHRRCQNDSHILGCNDGETY